MRYRKVEDGGAVVFKEGTVHSVACCDCGLVHTVRVIKGSATTTWTRHNRATASKRRKKYRCVLRKDKV